MSVKVWLNLADKSHNADWTGLIDRQSRCARCVVWWSCSLGVSGVFWLTAECGDYVESEFGYGPGYLKSMKLLPHQTEQLEMKIMGHHREHL